MNSCQEFDCLIDGLTESAKLIDIIEFKNERYAIYTVIKEDGLCDIYSSKVVKTPTGDKLVSYTDENAKKYIVDLINNAINC